MTKFYELPEQPSCMGRHGRQQSRPRHRRDFTFDTEENERASDLLASSQTKPKNKVTKTPERKKLFRHKINRYVIFCMALLISAYTSRSFVFLLS